MPRTESTRTIWKYPFTIADHVFINMPAGAEVLCVQMQRDTPALWAIVNPSAPIVARSFHVRGTGHGLNGFEGRYIGTVQLFGGSLVFHVFEGAA